MAWTTPITAVSNAAFTAAQFNASVRDNLLETAPAKFTATGQFLASTGANAGAVRVPSTASFQNTESTTSTVFADLTAGTAGPTVSSVSTGAKALVCVHTRLTNSTLGATTSAGWTVSGATTLAGSDEFAVAYEASAANDNIWTSGVWLYTGLNAGANTFKVVYKASAGTGSVADRRISIIPF
jgi:hypothetical protein